MAKLFSKETKRKFLVWIVPPVAFVLIKLLYFTCKKIFHIHQDASVTPSVYISWHGELLMMPFAYVYHTGRCSLDAIISQHFDGELIARFVGLFGGGAIRGSSSKGGIPALRSALHSIKLGRDIAIIPDGPRGPRYSVADGVVAIAQFKKIPIVTINVKPSSYWKLKSWDQFCIPKPFCTLEFYIGEPFFVNDMEMNEAKSFIQERLCKNAI